MDGLPGLRIARRKLGRSERSDKIRSWVRSVWYGKLDAVLLGWLIGVFIAVINYIVQTYGAAIGDFVVHFVQARNFGA